MNVRRSVILTIDTSSREKIAIGIKKGKENFLLNYKGENPKGEVTLSLVDKLLKKHNLKLKDITEILVNQGPGSFTGLRIGIAIANALAYALKIPVNGKKIGEIVEPVYE